MSAIRTLRTLMGAVVIFISSCGSTVQEDTCQSETFKPRCRRNEAIVMTTAKYGRMRIGRCVESSLGFVGCKTDVLFITDLWCSGRNSCDVDVPNSDLDGTKPCFQELKSYLHAQYTCVKMAYADHRKCLSPGPVRLETAQGYLSSHVTDRTGCGSLHSPWVIKASPGQHINISMIDLGLWRRRGGKGESSAAAEVAAVGTGPCDVYAYIVEPASGTNFSVCGGGQGQRTRHVFISTSSLVEIHVRPAATRGVGAHFMLHYTTLGCPDLNKPAHAWYERDGPKAVIGCEHTERSWHLTCHGTTWVGVVGNCSSKVEPDSQTSGQTNISTALSILLILGLAVLIAILVFVSGVMYLRLTRRRKPHKQGELGGYLKCGAAPQDRSGGQRMTGAGLKMGVTDSPIPTPPAPPGSAPGSAAASRPRSVPLPARERHANEYSHIWDGPAPTDPHTVTTGSGVADSDYASQSNYSGSTGARAIRTGASTPYEEVGGGGGDSLITEDTPASSLGDRVPRYFVLEKD